MAKLPDFSLAGSDGRTWTRADLAGKPAVIYLYPKDMTSGCTREACDFRDRNAAFAKLGTRVFGLSPDSLASHQKFIAKESLSFVLLADPDKKLIDALGAWVEKSMYGRSYMGVERSTFLIDAKGGIAQAWRKVKVPDHAEAVLAAARAL